MEAIKTLLEGLLVIKPRIFSDKRGYFFESYSKKSYETIGISNEFVQDNESLSSYGTLRGLHFQTGESAQAKLVRVGHGKIWDVAVDLREKSPTFLQHYGVELSDENKLQLFVPRGFAHGFVVLSESATLLYKADNFYDPKSEGGLLFDDPKLKIQWPVASDQLILTDKDRSYDTLQILESLGENTYKFYAN